MPNNTYNDYGTPFTRAEAYLAQIAQNTGGDGSAEGIGNTYNDYGTPLTRAEALLATIMENTAGGGGGGSGGGVLVCHVDTQTYALDHTWQEIYDADFAIVKLPDEETEDYISNLPVILVYEANSGSYRVEALAKAGQSSIQFIAFDSDSKTGYPVINMG